VTGAPAGATAALRDHVAAGWRTATLHGSLAFGALMALSVGVGGLAAVGPTSGPDALRQAALVPAVVHRVPIDAGPVTVRAAFLLATAGAGWLLFLGGRAVARRTGGHPGVRAGHGVKVAVPYALGSLVLSLVALGASTGPVGSVVAGSRVAPSVPASLGWPLLFGAVCGAVGGVAGAPPETPAESRVRGVVAGGWQMATIAVLLGTAGLLAVMALHPAAVRSYVDAAFRRGPAEGILAVAGTALFLPNAGIGVASAAMGGGVEFEALGVSCPVVSYARIPEAAGTVPGPCGRLPFGLGSPGPGYLVFLLLPGVAAVAGGWLGARRSGAAATRDGALLGAMSGVAFAALFAMLSGAARVSYEAAGPVAALLGEAEVAVGPDPVAGFLLALVWGLGGGAVGGALALRRPVAEGNGPG
jgi:hypothetical protein